MKFSTEAQFARYPARFRRQSFDNLVTGPPHPNPLQSRQTLQNKRKQLSRVLFALVATSGDKRQTQSTRERTFSRAMRQPGCKPGPRACTHVPPRRIRPQVGANHPGLRAAHLSSRWTEFDAVWETANKICDRYDLGNRAREGHSVNPLDPVQFQLFMPAPTSSWPESSSSGAPAQTPPPVAASPDSPEYEPASAPL